MLALATVASGAIGDVHASVEGVVENEDVPGIDILSIFFQEGPHGERNRGDVMRESDALGDHLPLGVAQRGGKVQAIPNNGGTGGAVEAERHLVRGRGQGVLHDGQGDRIGLVGRVILAHGWEPAPSMTTFRRSSSQTRVAGGTTRVESYSSINSGPWVTSRRELRVTTGVSMAPHRVPK